MTSTPVSRRPFIAAATAFLIVAGVAVTADSAAAQSISRHSRAYAHGPYHSAAQRTDVHRSPGSASVQRQGRVDGQAWSSSRTRTTVDTGNGYATSAIHTGWAGETQVRNGSVSYGDDSYSRSSGVQTSNGYGYDRQVDAYRDENGVTVNRSTTANNGASRSSSVTRSY